MGKEPAQSEETTDLPRPERGQYSSTYFESPKVDALQDGGRYWWCNFCGAAFKRHHKTREYKFCYNCEQRDALLIELTPVGPDAEKVGT